MQVLLLINVMNYDWIKISMVRLEWFSVDLSILKYSENILLTTLKQIIFRQDMEYKVKSFHCQMLRIGNLIFHFDVKGWVPTYRNEITSQTKSNLQISIFTSNPIRI